MLEGCTASLKKMNLCSAVNLKYFQSPFVSLGICVEVVRVCVCCEKRLVSKKQSGFFLNVFRLPVFEAIIFTYNQY